MKTDLERWSQEVVGHQFRNPKLLLEALTHTTYANEHPRCHSNERLEFLGDAVVGMVIAEHLFLEYPDLPEGELTKIRAAVVCEPSLAVGARSVNLGRLMRFGKGEQDSGGERDSILSDAFEALVGALFLDGGLDVARSFILRELGQLVQEALKGQVGVDHKTRLQVLLQRKWPEGPVYRLLSEQGPPHDKRFQVAVYHRGTMLGTGWGRSKKEAEQEAAQEALAGDIAKE